MLGYAIDDKRMIRYSLVELIAPGSKKDKQILEGLISILMNDSENEECIKELCNGQLDINGNMYLQLMDLTSPSTLKLP